MIKEIEIGEIVRIEKKEYLIVETQIGSNSKKNTDLKRVNIKLLDGLFKKTNRKPYFKRIKQNGKIKRKPK